MPAKRTILFAGLLIALLLRGGVSHAEPLKLRVGWIVLPGTWAPLLFEKKEVLKHYGQSYVVESVHFQATPLEITALASGELDIASLTFSSFAIAVRNAGMDDLRVVADEQQDGVEGYFSNECTVLKDSPIKTVEDLKGKVLAVNAIGSAGDMMLRVMLKKHGISLKDVTVIEAALPNMNAMLESHKIDLASTVPPFAYEPEFLKVSRVLFTQREAMGRTQFSFWAARVPYLAAHRAALTDFMEDALRAARWFLDPAHHAEAVALLAEMTKQQTATFDWAFTRKDIYRDPNLRPDIAALQHSVDTQRELGFLGGNVDVAKHIDLSIVEAAAERLK